MSGPRPPRDLHSSALKYLFQTSSQYGKSVKLIRVTNEYRHLYLELVLASQWRINVQLIDARIDRVVVQPVPGQEGRYAPLVLDPAPLVLNHRRTPPSGCVPSDMDEDGDLDLLVAYVGRPPLAYLRQGGGYRAVDMGLDQSQEWHTTAVTIADIDGDGHNDIVLGN